MNKNIGAAYCRSLLEVRAVRVKRDNEAELKAFVGSGRLVLPESADDLCYFYTTDEPERFSALEGDFIVRYPGKGFEVIKPDVFLKNFEPKDTPETTTKIYNTVQRFDMLFGRNLDLRLRKLTEEYNELISAAENYRKNGTLTDKDKENIVDELADVNAVIFHIASLFGLSQTELLAMAVDKIEGRLHNPDYKRKHPHTGDECCGNCKHFVNEEAGGDGYCYNQGQMRHCSCSGCEDWKNGVGQ